MNPNNGLYACGAILLGVIGIVFHDFAMQWQPVPAGFPIRTPLAYVSGIILVIGGAALLSPKGERGGAWLLTVFLGLWTLTLNLPAAIASYTHIGAWNSPAEIAFMTMGGLALVSSSAGALRKPLARIARIVAGLSACVFGFAHFNYIEFTAGMVPAWIPPNGVFWAWATGAGHLAAGLALVSGIKARLAATLLAGMMASFVVLLHVPRVVAAPDQHVEWIMLGVSSMLTGAAWLLRKHAFVLTLAVFGISFVGLGISMYPYLIPNAITLQKAAAPESSQAFMLVGAAVLVPVILAYTAWSYWVFRGKVAHDGYH